MWRIAIAVLLASCEASPHLHVKVRGVMLDPAKLHVEDDARGDAQFTPSWSPAHVLEQRAVADGIDLEIGLGIGAHVYTLVRVWYDANGNHAVDAGDLIGELSTPFDARDRGGCSSRDANRAPDIVLAPRS
jgi:hypothetical protein